MKLFIKKASLNAIIVILLSSIAINLKAQINIILDNYYNHETNPKTGKLYHYLWSDTTFNGYSRWGEIFKEKGCALHLLQSKPTESNLRKADIYIIADPDIPAENPSPNYIVRKDIKTIVHWVKNGGVLILFANDSGNCEFEHLNALVKHFGMRFNEVSLLKVNGNNWNMGAIKDLSSNPVFSGVKKIYLKQVSSLTLWPPAAKVLVKDGHIIMAESHIGKGFVFAVGDPWIYNEYIDHDLLPVDFDNYKAAENLSAYLINLARKP